MEFKFRAVDDRPPPPPPPIFTSFSEPPFPLPSPMPGHSFTPMSPFSNFPTSGGGFRPNLSPMHNPNNAADQVMRNLEKERIREEMIMGEIARRRELEAEVREEIMFLERELMAKRRAAMTGGFSFDDSFAPMQCNARPLLPPPLPIYLFGDQLVPMQCSASPRPLLGHSSTSEPVVLPLDPPPEDVTAEFKASNEPNKDKLIVLAKPDPNLCGTKRKAVEPPTLEPNELHPFGLKKKPKEEWSCALCHVSATSEKVLNDHLLGKKHMAKEAKLISQNGGKNPNNAPVPKKTGRSTANAKLEAEVEAKTSEQNEAANVSSKKKNRKKNKKKDLKHKTILPRKKDKNATDLKNTVGSETVVQADRDAAEQRLVKKFNFWCEMCRVGSMSTQVMEDHKKGKKHLGKLLVYKCKNGDGAASQTIHIPSEAIVPKPEATDVVATIIPEPEDPNGVYEPHKSNKAVSKTTNFSSEPFIPNPNVIYDPNKTDEAASRSVSLKAVIKPKSEDPDVGFEPNKSNEASSKSSCVLPEAIIPKRDDPDVDNQANAKTAIESVENLDNRSLD